MLTQKLAPAWSRVSEPESLPIWLAIIFSAVGGYAVTRLPSPEILIIALLGAVILFTRPAAFTLLVTLVCQEIRLDDSGGTLATFGNQIYFAGTVPPIFILVGLAATIAILGRAKAGIGFTSASRTTILLGLLLAIIAISLSYYAGQTPISAINQTGRPFILLTLGMILGATLNTESPEVKKFRRTATLGVAALTIGAAWAIAIGESADARVSRFFIFYDSATAAAGAAILLGIIFSGRIRIWNELLVSLGCLAIVAMSFRRNVWIALAVVLIVCLIVGRLGGATLKRVSLAVLGTTLLGALIPEMREAAVQRMADAYLTLNGSYSDASTMGHLDDIHFAWDAAWEHPLFGVGPEAPQLAGMAAQNSTRVYVHNELLLDWLRFGATGAMIVLVLQIGCMIIALAYLRRGTGDIMGKSAAAFALIAPICMVTAPFLSTGSRWPILYGLSIGILTARFSPTPTKAQSPIPAQLPY